MKIHLEPLPGHRCQNPERDAAIAELAGAGQTYKTIGEQFGLSVSRICVIVAYHGARR